MSFAKASSSRYRSIPDRPSTTSGAKKRHDTTYNGVMIRVLALDFDGVIADSARESYLVAASAFRRLAPDSVLLPSLPDAVPGHLHPPDRADPVYGQFLGHMPLGNRAEDYGVVLRAIERRIPLPDQASYDRFKATLDCEWLRSFHETYYRVRRWFQQADPGGWLALPRPYPWIPESLRSLSRVVELAIATARDRESVDRILAAHGLADLFEDRLVVDKEAGVSKLAHIELLLQRTGVAPGELLFVDDKVNHLEAVEPAGTVCGLATWGYNSAREHRLARERGYLLLEPDDLVRVVQERS